MASQPPGFGNGKGGGGGNGNAPFSGTGGSALADHLPPQNLEAERWLLGGVRKIRCRKIRCQFSILARKNEPTRDYAQHIKSEGTRLGSNSPVGQGQRIAKLLDALIVGGVAGDKF